MSSDSRRKIPGKGVPLVSVIDNTFTGSKNYIINDVWYRFFIDFVQNSVEGVVGTGVLATDGTNITGRTLTSSNNRLSITNGDGISGNPTLTINEANFSIGTSQLTGTISNAQLAGSITAAKLVGTDIDTVGTITSGTWNGSVIDVSRGGTGRASHTAYAVICGGTASGNAQQSIASVGTSGDVLTSNGAGALPTFQTPSAAGVAGSDTQVQFNDGGAFGADADLVYNKTTNTLTTTTFSGALSGNATTATTAVNLSNSGTAVTTTDSSGRFTLPNQPSFHVGTTALSNVTGDGTDYTTVFNSENRDIGSNFASGTFTIPKTGFYLLFASIGLTGLTSSHTTGSIWFVNAGTNYFIWTGNPWSLVVGGVAYISGVFGLPLTAAGTVVLHVQVSGGTKDVDVNSNSIWGGHLLG